MVIIKDIDECNLEHSVVALGKFDGVHTGHQSILRKLIENSTPEVKVVVITFSESPEAVLTHKQLKYLMTSREKSGYFNDHGVDYLIDIPLTQDFLDMEADTFVEEYLYKHLGVKKVVCGTNFHFGKGRKGNIEFLKQQGVKYGFETLVVDSVEMNERRVSSTAIRAAVTEGDVVLANRMMGHMFEISGKVIKGRQLGRQLEFPTINIIPPENKILPANGVYVTKTVIDGHVYDSITNVGVRPTVTDISQTVMETNIFDFNGDLYGEDVKIFFVQRIRGEKKFKSVEDLQKQIKKDVEFVKSVDKFPVYAIM